MKIGKNHHYHQLHGCVDILYVPLYHTHRQYIPYTIVTEMDVLWRSSAKHKKHFQWASTLIHSILAVYFFTPSVYLSLFYSLSHWLSYSISYKETLILIFYAFFLSLPSLSVSLSLILKQITFKYHISATFGKRRRRNISHSGTTINPLWKSKGVCVCASV